MPKISVVEGEEAAVIARYRVQAAKVADRYHCGLNVQQLRDFRDGEFDRLRRGVAPLTDLPIDYRALHALQRLGCRTVEGVEWLRRQGMRPFGIGIGRLPALDQAIANFRQQQR